MDMNINGANGSGQGDLIAELAKLRAENEGLKARAAARAKARLHLKVGEKGNVCVYGLGRFPVSLYLSQWTALIDFVPEIKAFIADNIDKLATKE